MGQGEHLRRLRIRPIDKDQRGHRIGECEAAKFSRIKTAVVVVHDNPAHHHEYTGRVGMSNELSQGILPCRTVPVCRDLEGKCFPHLSRHGLGRHITRDAPYKCQGGLSGDPGKFPIPGLPFLTCIEYVQQVRTWTSVQPNLRLCGSRESEESPPEAY